MKTFLKVCGITNVPDALEIARAGVDFAGLIFSRESQRCVSQKEAQEIYDALKRENLSLKKVGVFTCDDADFILDCARKFDLFAVQLHGGQSEDFVKKIKSTCPCQVWKAFWINSQSDCLEAINSSADKVLIDSSIGSLKGGTGVPSNWNLAEIISRKREIILAGGISEENISQAISEVSPWCADANSKVQIDPRKKDISKIKKILNIIGK